MELRALIDQIKTGDLYAFTELVRRYQDLAFGYAYAILGDFHLAQDAAQEAFVVTYADLGKLRDPEAFPGWLRGIVRYQCGRILRKRHFELVPLDHASDVAAKVPGPEEHAEQQDALAEVIAAINGLPLAQREVVTLYYIREYSQQEVAAFLDLPVTMVNNRLYAARKQLKRRMLPMVKDALKEHGLPEDFARKVGRIVEVRGPIVDVRFPPDQLPALLSELTLSGAPGTARLTVEVVQHLGDGIVRGVTTSSTAALTPGMEIANTGTFVQNPLAKEMLGQAFELLGETADKQIPAAATELLETGIKVLDLLCPSRKGGKVGVIGPLGVGKLVLVEELVHNVARRDEGVSVFTFFRPGNEVAFVEEALARKPAEGTVQMIVLSAEDPSNPGPLAAFDSVTYMSRDLAVAHLYPAVDPLRSTSQLLDPAIVGQQHFDVAQGVRQLLGRAQELQSGAVGNSLTNQERTLVARARKAQRFLTQPFFVAEPYTNRLGQYVSREQTIKAFGELLAGTYDGLPEEAFQWCGTIDQVVEKAKSMTTDK